METGGYKGRSREVAPAALYAMLAERLGIPAGMIVTEYGMTEMGSQFYSSSLRASVGLGDRASGVMRPPPWVRTRIFAPEDPEMPIPAGCEPGLIRHIDLVNRGSVASILTADLGIERDGGFEVLGRASGAELRGCSLALEELRRA